MNQVYSNQSTAGAADSTQQPIAEINIGPLARQNLSLGSFSPASPPTGFAVQPVPDDKQNSIVTELISEGTANSYELILRVVNHGAQTERIKVWQM